MPFHIISKQLRHVHYKYKNCFYYMFNYRVKLIIILTIICNLHTNQYFLILVVLSIFIF